MWLATAITFAFCLGEALVGYKSDSLALMADAGHNFADALALALSAFALLVATKPADNKRTFGYHRVGMELNQVEQAIHKVKSVLDVHDLHVWTVPSGLIACNCHILIAEQSVSAGQKIQQDVTQLLEHDFKIRHSTIQIEVEDCGGHDHTKLRDDEHEHKHAH
jgi:cobalt-zinc-cadmium efflux system protein